MKKTCCALFLLIFGLVAQAADNVVGGPYAIHVGPNSATVAWVVRGPDDRVETSSGKGGRPSSALRVEKLIMRGLQPGRTYQYTAFEGGRGKGQFRTPPSSGAPFRFYVYGDTRSRHDVHARVIAAMVQAPTPDFVLHTGDLVADGSDSAQWPVFFSIEQGLLRKTAFFPSLGNHERNNPRYYSFFEVQTPYYSFNWGNTHIVVLNSDLGNVAGSRTAYWSEELRWLEDDLAAHGKADLVFVVLHHPPFTAVGRRQKEESEIRRGIVPLVEKFKVNCVFSGHDHNYQHHLRNGVHYIVTGGGGAPLYAVDAPVAGLTLKVESTEHFVGVEVNRKGAKIQAFGLDGRVIDTVELARRTREK